MTNPESASHERPVLAFTSEQGQEFYKSSYSGTAGCVAVAHTVEGGVLMGDTKNPEQTPLSFSIEEWQPFIAAVKAGQFDLAPDVA